MLMMFIITKCHLIFMYSGSPPESMLEFWFPCPMICTERAIVVYKSWWIFYLHLHVLTIPSFPMQLISPWFCECLGRGLFPDLVCICFYIACYVRQKGISNFRTLWWSKSEIKETRLKSSTWAWSNNSSHEGKFGSVPI